MTRLALAVAVAVGLAACGGPETSTFKQEAPAGPGDDPGSPTDPTPPPTVCPYKGRLIPALGYDPNCAGGTKIPNENVPQQWYCVWGCNADHPAESYLAWVSDWSEPGLRIEAMGAIPYCEFDPFQACASVGGL